MEAWINHLFLLAEQRPDILATYFLHYFGWFPVFCVIIWGMTQVWLDYKQGEYVGHVKWVLLQIHIPKEAIQTPKGMENFFQNLAGSKSSITWKEAWLMGKIQPWFTFEIVSDGGNVGFYIRTPDKYVDLVEAAMYAQYPEAQIIEIPPEQDYVLGLRGDYPNDTTDLWGSEMILQKPNFFPIRTWEMFEHTGEKDMRFKDPILPIIEILGKMKPGEKFWIQILIRQPNEQDWAKEGTKYINKTFGKVEKKAPPGVIESTVGWIPAAVLEQSIGLVIGGHAEEPKQDDWAAFKITTEEKNRLDAVAEKISKIGWQAKVRVIYAAPKKIYRKGTIAAMTKGIFHQFAHLSWNKFGLHDPSTPKDDYFWQEWQMPYKQRVLYARYKKKKFGEGSTPYILNSEELATLFHFPAADARTPILTAPQARRAEAPLNLAFSTEEQLLPNFERSQPDTHHELPVKQAPLSVPNVAVTPGLGSPSNSPIAEGEVMPRPGMPAPLPPGLSLADTPFDPTPDAPDNLPL